MTDDFDLPITVEGAEHELFATCERMGLKDNAALYVFLREYTRMKREIDPAWNPPVSTLYHHGDESTP